MNLDTIAYRKDKKYPAIAGQRAHGYGRFEQRGGVAVWAETSIRALGSIKALLIHTTNNADGNTHYTSEARFLCDSWDVSSGYVVSSHDATVVQLLPDEIPAWHSGDCRDNDFENATSIGIEIAWTPSAGQLPTIAIDNLTALVRSLLVRIPSITKIDMHRVQALPAGRKIDPSGWADAAFYAWRAGVLPAVPAADPWQAWGLLYPLPIEQRSYGLPLSWYPERRWLGEARGPTRYDCSGLLVSQVFQGGLIAYDRRSETSTLTKFPRAYR